MLETLAEKLCTALTRAGLPARAAYPAGPGGREEAVYLTLERAETPEGNRPQYLGLCTLPGAGEQEVYGLRCKAVLALEVCVPLETEHAARAALTLLHQTVEALSPAYLRLEQLRREEPTADRAAGVMRLRGSAQGALLLLFDEPAGDEAQFGDFVLRGELMV